MHRKPTDQGDGFGKVSKPLEYGAAFIVAAIATCLGFLLKQWLAPENLIMLYLAGVAVAASRLSFAPTALTAGLSVAAFDFFFVPPHLSFAVSDTQYLLTFAVMLAVALLISGLAQRLRSQLAVSEAKEQRAAVLYEMSRAMAESSDAGEIARIGALELSETLHFPVAVCLQDGTSRCSPGGDHLMTESKNEHVQMTVQASREPLGIVVFQDTILEERKQLVISLVNGLAVAIERCFLAAEERAARIAAATEQTRNVLLNSVSHDLRTPLTVIAGAASALVAGTGDQTALAVSILEESERMNRHVQNLLDLSRFEGTHLRPRLEWHSVEEIVGSALGECEHLLRHRDLRTFVPPGLALVQVDSVLLHKALVNLLENAARHTGQGGQVELRVSRPNDGLRIEVADRGTGIPAGEESRIFEKFYQPDGTNSDSGFGLGLAICKAVAEAHGGTIRAENRPGGGARFIMDIRTVGTPPTVPNE